MTCIAALKQTEEDGNTYIYMSGERAVSNDMEVNFLSTPKIWKWGEYLVGYAGHLSALTVFNSFMPPQPRGLRGKELDKFMYTQFLEYLIVFYEDHSVKTDSLDLLIAVGDRIYEHSTDNMSLYVYDTDYNSIGSGSPFVMASLFSTADSELSGRERIKLALQSAVRFSPSCGGKIDILKQKI
jgi:ATP-dependent protease HslVU (ClpYQ) peptidase subunit